MKKEEIIAKYGEAAYETILAQRRAYHKAHKEEEEYREKANAAAKKYVEENPEKIKANQHEANRKGGKRYARKLEYITTGLQGERNKIRYKHGNQYRPYKQIIAPDSQIHHEWVPNMSDYRGVALVEADQHMHGFVDVIEILEGKITLLTEEEVKRGKKT